MNLHEWFLLLIKNVKETQLLEWLAVGFGLAEVLLARKNSIWLYPAGIISVTLTMVLLSKVSLYAEIVLNMYYLVMSIYGWIHWKNQEDEQQIKPSWAKPKAWLVACAIVLLAFLIFYFSLIHLPGHFKVVGKDIYFTKSDVPFADAFVSAFAWAGMWLLAQRKVENWLFLNISNLVAIPLLFHKQLPLLAFLTIFLFVVAIFGFFDWKKMIKNQVEGVFIN